MLQSIKSLIPKSLKRKLRETLYGDNWYEAMTFSQFGEDAILRQYFDGQSVGLFVDVGAYQPVSLSNTYYFYLKGWRGINIEPNPKATAAFRELRPLDNNLQMGISNEPAELDYVMMDDKPYENSFSTEQISARGSKADVSNVVKVKVDTLANVLEKHVGTKQIDFISIDVEGLNLEVVQSNNWRKYRPTVALIEKHHPHEEDKNKAIVKIMEDAGYLMEYDIVGSYFFVLPEHSLQQKFH